MSTRTHKEPIDLSYFTDGVPTEEVKAKRKKDKPLVLVGDFETTVYEGQTDTEVWASALVPLYSEDVKIFHSIDETWEALQQYDRHLIVYYHNLKFDGTFWLDFFIHKTKLKQAIIGPEDDPVFYKEKDMPNNSFFYTISDKGQWYSITIKVRSHIIELRDSLKLLPFSVKKIGKSFGTKHKKLDMEYEGYRYAGCVITDKEKEYIANDVLVVKEALEIMYDEGHTNLTIGACCLNEYKHSMKTYDYKELFPNVYDMATPNGIDFESVGHYVLKSYRGGWCYLVKGKENKRYHNGTTADVNSLYPSMMSSESGNVYPVGKPTFWIGNEIPKQAIGENKYFFIRFRCRFYIKDGYLPFIQIKGTPFYKGTECLDSSDYVDKKTGKHYRYYTDFEGRIQPTTVTMTMTCTDWYLFNEHYNIEDLEILDGCWFFAMKGIFDDYMEKYKKIKMTSKGAKRELAKLFLNNLYGKMAATMDSSFKVAYDKDGVISYKDVEAHEKKPGYIPVGSAITSYARNFTIRAAQKNYHGVNERGFIYADTDSIHCDLAPEEIVGVPVHPTDFCHWKLETCWDEAIFVRQKTYIEHVTHEDTEPIEKPYYNVKCAGMNTKCKNIFIASLTQEYSLEKIRNEKLLNEAQIEFIQKKRDLEDFKVGLKIEGKLMPKRIKGGTVLIETTYEMR